MCVRPPPAYQKHNRRRKGFEEEGDHINSQRNHKHKDSRQRGMPLSLYNLLRLVLLGGYKGLNLFENGRNLGLCFKNLGLGHSILCMLDF